VSKVASCPGTDEFVMFLLDVRGANFTSEFFYLMDLIAGAARLVRLQVPAGSFILRDIVLNIKSRNNSSFLCPRKSDARTAIMPSFEKETWRFVRQIMKPRDIFIDVGAHVGVYTIPIAKIVGPYGRVLAIEPSPISLFLIRSIELNSLDNVVVIRKAAYETSRIVSFNYDQRRSGISQIDGISPIDWSNGKHALNVEVEPLDMIANEYLASEARIRLLKIDAEGAEVGVLKGANSTLSRTQWLVLEVRKSTISNCGALLKKKGFKIISIVDKGGSSFETVTNLIFKNSFSKEEA
jgi:FkbM family methyltransferase